MFLPLVLSAATLASPTVAAEPTIVATHEGRNFHLDYEAQMQSFAKADLAHLAKGNIVFTGSSSFVGWQSLKKDMDPLPVVNRAFGGSDSIQLWHYAPRAVLPLEPRLVVVYIGDNDLPQPQVNTESYMKYVDLFVQRVRAAKADTRFIFVSTKPSPSRWSLWPKAQGFNKALSDYCSRTPLCTFVDITPTLLDANAQPREDAFQPDKLHVLPWVYGEWTRIIRPVVEKQWAEINNN